MKKLLSLILAALLLSVCLVGCDADGSGKDTQHVHELADATCKDPQKCSCGYTKGEPLNAHSFEKGVCTVCEKELIDELGRIAKADNEKKKEQNQTQLYSVSHEGAYVSDNIESISVSMGESTPSAQDKNYTDGYTDTLTVDQESLTTGTYEWKLTRRIYIKEGNYYATTHMFGTITAADFSAAATLTLAENPDNYTAFTETEKPDYMAKASKQLDLIVKNRLSVLLVGNESGLTVADLGFAKYQ